MITVLFRKKIESWREGTAEALRGKRAERRRKLWRRPEENDGGNTAFYCTGKDVETIKHGTFLKSYVEYFSINSEVTTCKESYGCIMAMFFRLGQNSGIVPGGSGSTKAGNMDRVPCGNGASEPQHCPILAMFLSTWWSVRFQFSQNVPKCRNKLPVPNKCVYLWQIDWDMLGLVLYSFNPSKDCS